LSEIANLYRHEHGHLVAWLTQRVGLQHLTLIQDSVQLAIEQAIVKWTPNTTPSNPTGWLYQTAFRFFLSELRANKRKQTLLTENQNFTNSQVEILEEPPLKGELSDALLRMLFLACDEKIPIESQLVFTLKSLCGFSISAISIRLLINEENAYKRYSRAKQYLKQQHTSPSILQSEPLPERLPAVLRVLYVVFTEGYLSSHPKSVIRKDLCEEAIRLALLLSKSEWGNTPECSALIALMYFNIARIDTRHDGLGLVLLEQQDRSTWDQANIYRALEYLNESARGDNISRYHVEASIAAEHCISPSFATTNWQNIVKAYELLAHISPSPLHTLNCAIASAE
jgi:predicted RNA polymerase sigma factor